MTEGTSTRADHRVPVHREIRGEVMVFQGMTVLDISHHGAQVETPFPLHVDSLHDFRLTLEEQSVVVKGRIAHSRVAELRDGVAWYHSGLEFIEPTEPVRLVIETFVEIFDAKRAIHPAAGTEPSDPGC